ncbi:MAG: hypothetical protein Q9209_007352 [Squamulea sp. 1 TL-2023]
MSYSHDDKENRPPPQSYFESVFDWSRKPLAIEEKSSRRGAKTVPLLPFGPPPTPVIGTFRTRLAPKHQPVGIWTPISQVHMPYNNAAIPPSEEVTGSASLPLARVKRILALDEDINQCSNSGAFVITEMFIRYLAEQALNVVKSERKPRRNIQYKDLASAVARIDNLEFLTDVIPKTTTFREYKEKKSKSTKPNASLSAGQTTLDGSRSLPTRPADVMNVGEEQAESDYQSEVEVIDGGAVVKNGRKEDTQTDSAAAHGHQRPEAPFIGYESEDVEMG